DHEGLARLHMDGLQWLQRPLVIGAAIERRAHHWRIVAVENAPAAEFELMAEAQGRRRMAQELVFLTIAHAATMRAGAGGIGDPFIALYANREFGLDHLDRRIRRHVEKADRTGGAVMVGFAALGAGEKLVLHRFAAGPVLVVADRDRAEAKTGRGDGAARIELREGAVA